MYFRQIFIELPATKQGSARVCLRDAGRVQVPPTDARHTAAAGQVVQGTLQRPDPGYPRLRLAGHSTAQDTVRRGDRAVHPRPATGDYPGGHEYGERNSVRYDTRPTECSLHADS